MAYREIVTKAVIAKGKKLFVDKNKVSVDKTPSTILGCWVINHNFKGIKNNNQIKIDGSYDVNIWYSYDNDTKTDVIKSNNTYSEVVNMRSSEEDINGEEIIVRSLKQPNCTKVEIVDNEIVYMIEKELGIELVGDVKVKIETNSTEDPWEEIIDESRTNEEINKIDDKVTEQFITDKKIKS